MGIAAVSTPGDRLHVWRAARAVSVTAARRTADRIGGPFQRRDMGVAQVSSTAGPAAATGLDPADPSPDPADPSPCRDADPGPGRHAGVARVPGIEEQTRPVQAAAAGPAVPVFVDDTGRRHRLLSWLALGAAWLGLLLVGLLWLSQTGPAASP